MKNLLILLCLLFFTGINAQDWGELDKNKLTMTEIAPIWPGCDKGSTADKDHCFNTKLATHIAKNFRYPAAEYKNNIQGRVLVDFIINEAGTVEVKKVSGGTAALQAEAKRNILSIPKMAKPGMLGGKPRAINYTVPFNFKTGK